MMKRAILGAAIVSLALVPSASQAQRRGAAAQKPIAFSLGAGVAMPMSDWGELVGTGFHVSGMGEKKLTGAPIYLRGELGFTMFGSKTYGSFGPGQDIKGSGHQIAGMFDVGYNFVTSSSVKPYFARWCGKPRRAIRSATPSAAVGAPSAAAIWACVAVERGSR